MARRNLHHTTDIGKKLTHRWQEEICAGECEPGCDTPALLAVTKST
jgi:hypothetical protein